MFLYKEVEEDLEEGYPTIPVSYKEVEKRLEVELVKFAIDKIFRSLMFENNGIITLENLKWTMKQLFSFEIDVKIMEDNHFELKMKDGDEYRILEFKIENHPVQ